MTLPLRLVLMCVLGIAAGFAAERKTASHHPMQYYLSLPEGWTSQKRWPVVFIIESANKEFEATAEAFRAARGARPFILVTPLVTTNGGPRYREVPSYHYSDADWAQVEKAGRCRFDSEGLAAIASDVRSQYGGEDRYFLTGLEAAGHTIWMQLFTHPEQMRGVALVAPNYQGRCVEELGFSNAPARTELPVKIFAGSLDEMWTPDKAFVQQTKEAERVASAHGYRNISETIVPGKGHEVMAAEVLAYFTQLLQNH